MDKRYEVARKRQDMLGKVIVFSSAVLLIVLVISLFYFVASKGLSTFIVNKIPLKEFLFSAEWRPDREVPQVGALPFIVGSVLVSIFAILISAPLGVSSAIFMVEISKKMGQKILQPAIEIFVGIPSVVYGWLGLSVLVPFISKHFGGLGFSLLAGILVLAIMTLPTITSVSADTIRSLPVEIREASYALGATRWQTIRHVLIPAAKPGILTAIILGLARAFGEALAVQMVIGNRPVIPKSFLEPMSTITSIITMEMGNTVMGTAWNNALWSLALLLLIISFFFIILIRLVGRRGMYR
ncbi:MAG: ABC-type phosphate transport system, permease component [Caldanaerobacter subterraneus]|jgi:phosphate transport system permease protein|uniref:Phosphate transport system permease protein n=3 Tax=Caldanaerobacter subterraneus TaxID=911092 RepID=Q8R9I0_CALS4|nr:MULTISPECIES: phosphate ABC transporter permease subunit PstC [Caldanaerobacter]AAM24832.1 ABC-type phosphate transport system, permease component [Caldanaerobacter subterraneus subsp. tengcongensis MB4]ERM92822.1 phosphate ABC transporter permease [Caldanaerobacter subterraneus subsp. yonseiensis KB-1]KUK09211.1 MAG: ABC-type phosphate transport system, permease component [Caldanaerobacter subterraneus]MCS3915598.1 phosphate transport system permease protein [Caldanaerobacter subterraneus s